MLKMSLTGGDMLLKKYNDSLQENANLLQRNLALLNDKQDLIRRNEIIEKKINDFTQIQIPDGVTKICASGIGLLSLSGLPNTIIDLDVSNNKLIDLKYLPKSVINLRASKNMISTLEDIADSSCDDMNKF